MAKLIQPSMAGGEVSPEVGARVDLSKRAVAVELAENFIASFTGSMSSRPGLAFVAQCKPGAGPYRIVDFEFNENQTFVIELGDQYMRFHALGAQILDGAALATITGATAANPVVITSNAHGLSNGDEIYIYDVGGMTQLNGRSFLVSAVTTNTFALQDLNGVNVNGSAYTAYTTGGSFAPPYELATPWDAEDLFDINYAQSGDVMTLCHPDYPPQELVRIDNDTWTLTEIDLVPDISHPAGIYGKVNTTITNGSITGVTQANPAVVTDSGHGLSTGDRIEVTGVVGMTQLNNFLYRVEVIDANTFRLRYDFNDNYVNSTGFTAYASGGTWTKAIRSRSYVVTAVSATDEEESFQGTNSRTLSITGITKANPCVVTTSGGHGLAPYDDVLISGVGGMTELNGKRFEAVFISATTFSLRSLDGTDVNSTTFGTYTSGGTVGILETRLVASADSSWDNSIYWNPVAGATYYNVYATDTFGVFGFIGRTTKAAFEDRNLGPDYAATAPVPFNPFDSVNPNPNRYPGVTGFFGQRRWFANSNDYPNRFWASQVGHFNNLSRSLPALDTDSIAASIAARRINEIKHIVPLSDLILLTSGGEYRLIGDANGAITPSTIGIKPQSYYGSTRLRPIVAGEVGLFVSPGNFVRDLTYQFADDKFIGKDVTVLARHLFDYRTMQDWDFAPSPRALAFVVMDDGAGLFLTYQPEQDVYAWTRCVTAGDFKSVCAIRENDDDVFYVLVERVVNGNTVTFLERMNEGEFDELEDAFCVDAGLTLDDPITITGMTPASPVVVTAPAHGLSNGNIVDISGVRETTDTGSKVSADYNGSGFVVAGATTDTFQLQNPSGTPYNGAAFAAYSSGGKVRRAVTTITGLWHLEGAEVVVAANGYAETGNTVTGGSVTLSTPASRVHIGLPYVCRLRTLPLSTYGNGETVQGKAKNVSRLTVQVHRTMGMWYGPNEDTMREAKFGLPAGYGQPLKMVTDDIDVTMKGDWGKRRQIVIEQRSPLPITIMTLVPDAIVGGN